MSLHLTEEQFRALTGESQGEAQNPTWDRAKMQEAARKGESMAGGIMSSLDLTGAYLANADLERADLSHAILSRADLRGACLVRANLSGAYLLEGVQLDSAKLMGTKWDGAILKGIRAPKTNFGSATLVDCEFRKSIFQQADFRGARLEGVTFFECDLGRVNFRGVDLRKVHFPDSYLVGADLLGATIDWQPVPSWQGDRILLWAIVRECLTKEEVADLSRRAYFGEGMERPGVFKPWWTWFPKELIVGMSRWRQPGDNWPL
jgi:uncharacterized protein YjbI with pentapeptide repeats